MWARAAAGVGALGLYGWRIHDPVTSYEVFYNVSNWFTELVVAGEGEGAWSWARNFISLILIDQADGFLLGMAFFALVSIVLWPVKAGCRICGNLVARAVRRDRTERTGE